MPAPALGAARIPLATHARLWIAGAMIDCSRAARIAIRCRAAAVLALAFLIAAPHGADAQKLPGGMVAERVEFASADAKTTLVGYLFAPQARRQRVPGVVMMHGR